MAGIAICCSLPVARSRYRLCIFFLHCGLDCCRNLSFYPVRLTLTPAFQINARSCWEIINVASPLLMHRDPRVEAGSEWWRPGRCPGLHASGVWRIRRFSATTSHRKGQRRCIRPARAGPQAGKLAVQLGRGCRSAAGSSGVQGLGQLLSQGLLERCFSKNLIT